MKGDTPAAALRLMAQLPHSTVIRAKPEREVVHSGSGNPYGKRAVEIAGVRYPTCREARTKLRMGYARLYDMLNSGEAKYVE